MTFFRSYFCHCIAVLYTLCLTNSGLDHSLRYAIPILHKLSDSVLSVRSDKSEHSVT